MQARSWKNTPKIGFWTALLHGRHLVNESGSLEPLFQYRIQIVGKLPTVSFCKCSTDRALFPNSKSSRDILWRELPCLLQTDIKTPHWALHISPMSSSIKWEMWTSQTWWWKPKEWKCSELLLEHWWHQKRLELVLSQQMANIWSTTS